jgi:hypothetical protein
MINGGNIDYSVSMSFLNSYHLIRKISKIDLRMTSNIWGLRLVVDVSKIMMNMVKNSREILIMTGKLSKEEKTVSILMSLDMVTNSTKKARMTTNKIFTCMTYINTWI